MDRNIGISSQTPIMSHSSILVFISFPHYTRSDNPCQGLTRGRFFCHVVCPTVTVFRVTDGTLRMTTRNVPSAASVRYSGKRKATKVTSHMRLTGMESATKLQGIHNGTF